MAAVRRKVAMDDPFGYSNPVLYADGADPAPGGMPGTESNPNTGVGGTPTGTPTTEPAPAPAPKKYGAIQGFDLGKIDGSKPYDSGSKYSDSLRGFSNFLGEGGKIGRNDLGGALDWLHSNGFAGAKGVGDDKIDFGDGQGPIDVINSKGEVWFQNGDDRFVQEGNAAALGMPSGSGGGGAGGYGGGGGASGGSGGGSSSSGPGFTADSLKAALASLFPGGAFNQGAVDRNVDNVRGGIEKARKSRLATNQALLADRGLIGSGPESRAYQNMDEDLFNSEVSGINDAYSHESDNASQRMMMALQTAAGMTAEEARNAVDWFRAQSDNSIGLGRNANDAARNANDYALGQGQLGLGYYTAGNDFTLGQGRLAIDNMNGVNGYNLGVGRLGLDRDVAQQDLQGKDIDRLIAIINTLHGGASASAGGYR